MNVISLQSAVAYGHVGNSAAVFAMQRLGHERDRPEQRLAHVAGAMFDVVRDVRDRGLDELPLVERQADLAAPRSAFTPRPV